MTKEQKLLNDMGTHSISEFPKEACGIITKELMYIPCRNISKNPKTSFIIDPIDIYKNIDNILGFFHSHPGSSDPIPSTRDAESAMFSEYLFVVGFGTKFYRYWLEDKKIRFETINENYFKILNTSG